MNYFVNCQNVNEVKKEYHRLAFANHPDKGGDTATMQNINAEYQKALKEFDGFTSKGVDGKNHKYYYNQDIEEEIMEKIDEFIRKNLSGVELSLVGTWLWIGGQTKAAKDIIKELGFRWHSKRKLWYWTKKSYRKKRYNANVSFDDLKAMYGYQKFSGDADDKKALNG